MFDFQSSEFFQKNPNFLNSRKFRGNSSVIISCFWDKYFGKSLETPVVGSKTGVSEHSEFTENLEFVLFLTFQKLQKMTLKSYFGNREKLVPTRKPTQMFSLKFRMQGLIFRKV
jgi:hypothetical protein